MSPTRRGLTFLEVTVVIMIMGVLAAIGAPHFARAVRTRAARNAAIELAATVDYIRDVAVNEGRATNLAIDAANDRFSSTDVDFPDQIGTRISIPLKDRFDSSLELSASFDTSTSLSFDLEGTPRVSGNPVASGVILVTSYDVGFEIRINAGQSQVTIVEKNVTPAGDSALDSLSIDSGGL